MMEEMISVIFVLRQQKIKANIYTCRNVLGPKCPRGETPCGRKKSLVYLMSHEGSSSRPAKPSFSALRERKWRDALFSISLRFFSHASPNRMREERKLNKTYLELRGGRGRVKPDLLIRSLVVYL